MCLLTGNADAVKISNLANILEIHVFFFVFFLLNFSGGLHKHPSGELYYIYSMVEHAATLRDSKNFPKAQQKFKNLSTEMGENVYDTKYA